MEKGRQLAEAQQAAAGIQMQLGRTTSELMMVQSDRAGLTREVEHLRGIRRMLESRLEETEVWPALTDRDT